MFVHTRGGWDGSPIRDDSLRVAIVHDDLTQRGGAERVVLSLHRLFPDAPIYTALYDPRGTYPEFGLCDVRTTWLQRYAGRVDARRLLPLYPRAFDGLRLEGYDLVISSSSRFAHGVRVSDGFHLCYCYSPARFLYRADEYLSGESPAPGWARPVLPIALAALRRWDRKASRRPDAYVAISREIARRIGAAYGRTAELVFPPVDVERYDRVAAPHPGDEPSYLVVSRLLPYKRVDLAVEACTRRNVKLTVVGRGPAREALEAAAGPTVEFRSDVDDRELVELMEASTALIQPGTEDFGLMPLEANAAGRPVIAFASGGARDTVVEGLTGMLFRRARVDDLVTAMERLESTEWNARSIRQYARWCGEEHFHLELLNLLRRLEILTDVPTAPSVTAADTPLPSAGS